MTLRTAEEFEADLKSNGVYDQVMNSVFKFGFKIVREGSKNIVVELTKDEYREAVLKDHGRVLSDADILTACNYASGVCVSNGCRQVNGRCTGPHYSGYWYCLCDY